MNIVINTIPLLNPLTGVGKYIFHLTRSLIMIDNHNKYTFYNGSFSKELFPAQGEIIKFTHFKELISSLPFLKRISRKLYKIYLKTIQKKFDLYFEPNFIPLPIHAGKIVVTIHDFSFHLFPEWHPPERVKYFKKNFWENIKKADKIICDSNFIKNEAINLFNFPAEKLSTIYLGVDKCVYRIYPQEELKTIAQKYFLPPKFLFFLGSIEPRKNLKNLILAYLELGPYLRSEFKLILAGFKGWRNEEIHSLIRKSNGDIKFIGYVSEEDLGKIFNLAHLFVFPSFYEGFGLPPLEAMASGCPVVVSNVSSLPEICGEAAYYINPYDVNNISTALGKIIFNDEIRKDLRQKGLAHAGLFSWEKSARIHLKLFEEIITLR